MEQANFESKFILKLPHTSEIPLKIICLKYIFFSQYIFVSTEVEVKQEMLSQRCHQPPLGLWNVPAVALQAVRCCDGQRQLGETVGPAVSLLVDSGMPPTSVPD